MDYISGGTIPRTSLTYDDSLKRQEYISKYVPLIDIISYGNNIVDFTGNFLLWETSPAGQYYKLNYDLSITKIEIPAEYIEDISGFELNNFAKQNINKEIEISTTQNTYRIPFYYLFTQKHLNVLEKAFMLNPIHPYNKKILRTTKNEFISLSGVFNCINLFIFINKFFSLYGILLDINTMKNAGESDENINIHILNELKKVFTITNEPNKVALNNFYDLLKYMYIIKIGFSEKSKEIIMKLPVNTKYNDPSIESILPQEDKKRLEIINCLEINGFTDDIIGNPLCSQLLAEEISDYFQILIKDIMDFYNYLEDLNDKQKLLTGNIRNKFSNYFLMSYYYYRLQKKELLGTTPINVKQQLDYISSFFGEGQIYPKIEIDIIGNNIPTLYEYSMTTNFGYKYGNCVENTILQLIKLILWNPSKGVYEYYDGTASSNSNLAYKVEPLPKFKGFLDKIFIIEQGKHEKTQQNIDLWTALITPVIGDSDYATTVFVNDKYGTKYELHSKISNIISGIKRVFGEPKDENDIISSYNPIFISSTKIVRNESDIGEITINLSLPSKEDSESNKLTYKLKIYNLHAAFENSILFNNQNMSRQSIESLFSHIYTVYPIIFLYIENSDIDNIIKLGDYTVDIKYSNTKILIPIIEALKKCIELIKFSKDTTAIFKIIEFLLDKCKNINVQDEDNNTPANIIILEYLNSIKLMMFYYTLTIRDGDIHKESIENNNIEIQKWTNVFNKLKTKKIMLNTIINTEIYGLGDAVSYKTKGNILIHIIESISGIKPKITSGRNLEKGNQLYETIINNIEKALDEILKLIDRSQEFNYNFETDLGQSALYYLIMNLESISKFDETEIIETRIDIVKLLSFIFYKIYRKYDMNAITYYNTKYRLFLKKKPFIRKRFENVSRIFGAKNKIYSNLPEIYDKLIVPPVSGGYYEKYMKYKQKYITLRNESSRE
jgi:hypothetical protein